MYVLYSQLFQEAEIKKAAKQGNKQVQFLCNHLLNNIDSVTHRYNT